MLQKQRRGRKRRKALRRNGHSGERDQQRQGSCDRRAQSLLEMISEQNVGKMKGKEIRSVILDKRNKKRKEERRVIQKHYHILTIYFIFHVLLSSW